MKTAFVTGGSRGIGSAIALTLGKTFHVVVGFVNSEDKANDIVKEIVATGGSASTVQIDISDAESVDNAFAAIEKEYNSVDVLINNAGVTKDNILPRMKEDEWLEVIQTNLTGSFYTSQRAIKLMMKNKWGRIVFISSVVGLSGNQGQANYAASKAGLIGLAKSISKEMGSRNITSNVVAVPKSTTIKLFLLSITLIAFAILSEPTCDLFTLSLTNLEKSLFFNSLHLILNLIFKKFLIWL